MDTGYVLAWVVALSSGLAVVVALRRGGRPRGWLLVHGALLALLTGTATLGGVSFGGALAGALWVPAVLVPTLIARQLPGWISKRQYRSASIGARLIGFLHPADGWQHQHVSVAILAALDEGDLARAERLIQELPEKSGVRRSLRAHWWRASGRYEDAALWLEGQLRPGARLEPALLSLEIRIAGELGDFPRLISAMNRSSAFTAGLPDRASTALMLAAFSGDRSLTDELLETALPELPVDAAAFWRFTAAQRCGQVDEGAMTVLTRTEHAITRSATERRLELPLTPIEPWEQEACAPALERVREDVRAGALTPPSQGRPWATWAITAVLLTFFALEIPGGVENLRNLESLGALVIPMSLHPGQWWRIVTGGLLHHGWLHLILNGVAILYLGARVERRSGSLWLLLVFVVSNIGAMLLVVRTTVATEEAPGILIGASGGVMGILGAVLAWVVVQYVRHRSAHLRRELAVLVTIIALQTVFDAATPEVSGPVHLYGLILGFAVTLPFAWYRPLIVSRRAG